VVVGRAREDDSARLSELLQPRGDVHAVAVEVAVLLEHHVTEIDTDTEPNALVLRHILLPLGHAALDGDGAGDRVDHGGELTQGAVAHELDDAAPVLGKERLDERFAVALESLEGAGLVALDEPGVADHVGREDRGEPAFGAGCSHGTTLLGTFGAILSDTGSAVRPCAKHPVR
jgi:hypothetical protein